jgi:hypothetical protein
LWSLGKVDRFYKRSSCPLLFANGVTKKVDEIVDTLTKTGRVAVTGPRRAGKTTILSLCAVRCHLDTCAFVIYIDWSDLLHLVSTLQDLVAAWLGRLKKLLCACEVDISFPEGAPVQDAKTTIGVLQESLRLVAQTMVSKCLVNLC